MSTLQGSVRNVLGFMVIVAVVMLAAGSASGYITVSGSTTPVYGAMGPDPWLLTSDLTVGSAAGTTTMTVGAGSNVFVIDAMSFIGSPDLTGIVATLNVQDDNSGFLTAGLRVGPYAEGYLNVTNGGVMVSGESLVGGNLERNELDQVTGWTSGEGTASVSGASSRWDSSWLFVGVSGHGALDVNEGGTVNVTGLEDSSLLVGAAADGTGEVSVAGGSTLSVDKDLTLGVWGEGTLSVNGASQVSSLNGRLGAEDTSDWDDEPYLESLGHATGTGTATISGGSQWNIGDTLIVGGWGTGDLLIDGNAEVTVGKKAYIGGMPITLGPEETFSRDMLPSGTGTATVTGGGTLTVVGGDTLFVGYSGTGTLDVNNGGDVVSPSVILGGAPDSSGTVTVSGSGSTLTSTYEINVGAWGAGELTVSDGGSVSTEELLIGGLDASDVNDLPEEVLEDFGEATGPGIVTVTGPLSSLDAAERIYVGNYGQGTLDVNDGGSVTAGEMAVGVAPGSHGIVNIYDPGSHVEIDEDAGVEEPGYYPGVMIVGGYGLGEVTVSGEGQLTVDDVLYVGGYAPEELDFNSAEVGYDPNGTGTVTITGAGSTLTGDVLSIGYSGQGTLQILNDANVTSGAALVGVTADGRGDVLVDNADNSWVNTGSVAVGVYGVGTLTVQNGGHVDINDILFIGGYEPNAIEGDTFGYAYDPNGTGTVTVTGSGSRVQAYGVGVGVAGDGTLEIFNGGRVEGQVVGVGIESGGTGSVVVDGTGSTLQLSGGDPLPDELTTDGEGSVVISNGGTVNLGGLNAVLAVGGDTIVGSEGQGTMIVTAGDVVTEGLYIGGSYAGDIVALNGGAAPTGAVTITGSNSSLEVTGDFPMIVGYSGTGVLDVNAGGEVTTGSMVIGGGPDVTGTVTVNAGTVSADHEIIAGAWGYGEMFILNGGAVTTGSLSIGGFDDSNAPSDLLEQFGDPNGSGAVAIVGTGSSVQVVGEETLYVGYTGSGTLDVNDGGYLASETAGIGVEAGSTGAVTVTGYSAWDFDFSSRPIRVGPGSPSTWDNSGSAYVGGNGNGSLTVANGGRVNIGENLYIGGYDPRDFDIVPGLVGDLPTGTGTVRVTGDSSLLDVTGMPTIYVGYSGDGTLDVNDGAQVNTDTLVVGGGPGVTGTVTVHDANSTISVTNGTVVGAWGIGDVNVSDSGTLTTGGLYIGGFNPDGPGVDPALLAELGDPNGTGTVTITGAGSSLQVTGEDTLVVGAGGTGHLIVSNGADANSMDTFIGGYLTFDYNDTTEMDDVQSHAGTGDALVTGAGSTSRNDILVVGTGGSGTLDVTSGGQVGNYLGIVGFGADAAGRVTVSGPNSVWANAAGDTSEGDPYNGTLIVGGWGNGDLMVSNGAQVSAVTAYIGGFDLAELGDDGTPTNWGPDVPAGAGTVTVTGTGSALAATGGNSLYVGYSGNGTLNVLNGGWVETNAAIVGALADSNGLVVVDGTGSTLSIAGAAAEPNAAAQGQGEVIIRNGGLVRVKDPNGLLVVGGSVTVGSEGQGTMTVSNSAVVNSQRGVIGGYDPEYENLADYFDPNNVLKTGTGTATVTGAGSTWQTNNIMVGFSGDGTLSVASGGQVLSESAFIGVVPDVNGVVQVNGDGSIWTNQNGLVVGGWGNGVLTILDGAEVSAADIYIGGMPYSALGEGEGSYDPESLPTGAGTVTVDGLGSVLQVTVPDSLYVGYYGTGILDVNDGGRVESDTAGIAAMPGSTGAVTVEGEAIVEEGEFGALQIDGGTSSMWDNSGSLFVGGYGDGSLMIRDAGVVDVMGTVYVGGFDPSQFGIDTEAVGYEPNGTGAVTVSDSILGVGGPLYVGYGGEGTLTIEAGAQVTTTSPGTAYIGYGADSTGSVTVTGEGSRWTESGPIYVGLYGTGTLLIADGAEVDSWKGKIARQEGSEGTATVTGAGSLWDIGNDLYVGGGSSSAGGTGVLAVNDGGLVCVGGEVIVWPTGTVTGDGTVTILQPTTLHNYGTISPGDDGIGTLTVNGNVVFEPNSVYYVEIAGSNSDRLEVNGDVTLNGGTVQVASRGTVIGEQLYEIIAADAVTGEFSGPPDTALLSFAVDANLGYDPNSVWLHIFATNFDDSSVARTYNQRQVAGALQEIANQEQDNPITTALQQVPGQNVDDIRHAYDELSGQTRPPLGTLTAAGTSKFLSTVASRMQTLQTGLVGTFTDSGLLAMAGPDTTIDGGRTYDTDPQGRTFTVGKGSAVLGDVPWGLWGRGYGIYGDRETSFEVPGYTYSVVGGTAGLDYQFTDTLLGGLVVGIADGHVNFAESQDNTEFDARYVGFYGSAMWDKWYLDGAGTIARLEYDTERFVSLLGERLSGSFNGYELAAYAEVGQKWQMTPDLLLQPLISVQYSWLTLSDYTETGGTSALSFDEQTHESVKGSLGARLTKSLIETAGDFQARVQLRGRWVHEFGDDRASVDTSFASNPATVFNVRDDKTDRDSAVLGIGLHSDLSKHTRFYVDYDTRLNSDETIHVVSGSLQYRW
ncbi:MAG: autotransporter domain-containing protein [Sedimentisphaerales bacterium]|nr:autotransporter domain-containing protein [Sedimentisphaerales bacterium]